MRWFDIACGFFMAAIGIVGIADPSLLLDATSFTLTSSGLYITAAGSRNDHIPGDGATQLLESHTDFGRTFTLRYGCTDYRKPPKAAGALRGRPADQPEPPTHSSGRFLARAGPKPAGGDRDHPPGVDRGFPDLTDASVIDLS